MPNTHAPMLLAVGQIDARVATEITAQLPTAVLHAVSADSLRSLPPALALLVTEAAHARTARATGFASAIVIVGTPVDGNEQDGFLEQGTHFVDPASAPTVVRGGIAAALNIGADGIPAPVTPREARIRQLIAAGEIACELQHAFNNPLTALMTEIQMLQIDAPTAEAKAAAGRMLELARRLADLSRSLDAVRDRSRRL